MNDVAMAGDMALVVGLKQPFEVKNGDIVSVLSNPAVREYWSVSEGRLVEKLCNIVDVKSPYPHCQIVVQTKQLIPLRGNPDALTVETSKGRSVKA